MAPIVGNLRSVTDTLLSGANYAHSANHLLTPLIGFSVFCLFIGALIAGLDYLDSAKYRKINYLKYFLIAGVIFLTVDLSYGGYTIANLVLPLGVGVLTKLGWLIACLLITVSIIYAVSWMLRENLPAILVAVFGVFFVSTIVMHVFGSNTLPNRTYAPSNGGNANLSPVIHLILDEMIGVEGLDRDIPGGEETYQIAHDFHKRFGFRLYGKAFSRHYWTSASIPNLLNYDYTDTTYGTASRYVEDGEWKYFDDLQHQGFDINIYQSSHLDFCNAGNITRCETASSYNPASIYVSFPGKDASTNLSMNAIVFGLFMQKMSGSYFSAAATRLSRLTLGQKLIKRLGLEGVIVQRYDVQSFNLWFDAFAEDVVQTQGGEVFLAHFLVPHAPFILDKQCEIKSIPWYHPYSLKQVQKLDDESFLETRRAYYELYYEQVACVYSKLTTFMERIEGLDQFDNATVVLHGDHGSRISAGQFFEGLSDQDLVDNYSTLFSIRSPLSKPGYVMRSVSVQRLFAEIYGNEDKRVSMDTPDTIAVNSKETGHVVSAKMPVFGVPSPTSEE